MSLLIEALSVLRKYLNCQNTTLFLKFQSNSNKKEPQRQVK